MADSAICTTDNLQKAKEQGIYLVTRAPDNLDVIKAIINDTKESELELLDDSKDCHVFTKWCSNTEVCGQVLKLLLVQNVKMQKQKTETVNGRAKKELENTLKAIKKLETNLCKCKADAQKSIESISKKLKYCTLSDVIYTECTKNKSRGDLRKN